MNTPDFMGKKKIIEEIIFYYLAFLNYVIMSAIRMSIRPLTISSDRLIVSNSSPGASVTVSSSCFRTIAI